MIYSTTLKHHHTNDFHVFVGMEITRTVLVELFSMSDYDDESIIRALPVVLDVAIRAEQDWEIASILHLYGISFLESCRRCNFDKTILSESLFPNIAGIIDQLNEIARNYIEFDEDGVSLIGIGTIKQSIGYYLTEPSG